LSWLLDTNTCSYVLTRRLGVAERLRQTDPSQVHISAVTVAEARTGALKSPNKTRLLSAWEYLLHPFADRILPFDTAAAEHYAEIRAGLEQKGEMIGDRDCMIAAIACAHKLTIVTSNTREFCRVPQLTVENWAEI